MVMADIAERAPHIANVTSQERVEIERQAGELRLPGAVAQARCRRTRLPELFDCFLQRLSCEQRDGTGPPACARERWPSEQVAACLEQVSRGHASLSLMVSVSARAWVTSERREPRCSACAPLFSAW